MPLAQKLRAFLDANFVEYKHTVHPIAYTACQVASAEHLPTREVAKSIVIFADAEYHLAVVPANRLVDFQEVRAALGFKHARLATEEELSHLFPDCEVGAMPPLGNLYGVAVYLDSGLAAEEIIAFNGGTHRDVVHMKTADFRRLVHPQVVPIACEVLMGHGW